MKSTINDLDNNLELEPLSNDLFNKFAQHIEKHDKMERFRMII